MLFSLAIWYFSIMVLSILASTDDSILIIEIVDKEKIPKDKLEIFELIASYLNGSRQFDYVDGDKGYIFWRKPMETEKKLIQDIVNSKMIYRRLKEYRVAKVGYEVESSEISIWYQFTHPSELTIYVEMELWDEEELNDYSMPPKIDKLTYKDPFERLS